MAIKSGKKTSSLGDKNMTDCPCLTIRVWDIESRAERLIWKDLAHRPHFSPNHVVALKTNKMKVWRLNKLADVSIDSLLDTIQIFVPVSLMQTISRKTSLILFLRFAVPCQPMHRIRLCRRLPGHRMYRQNHRTCTRNSLLWYLII